jgi:hypothetical protein
VERSKISKKFKNKDKWLEMLKENQTLSGKPWVEVVNKPNLKIKSKNLIKRVELNQDSKKREYHSQNLNLLSKSLSM